MIEKIQYFLDHGLDVHSSVGVNKHISVTVFNNRQKIVADADYHDHGEYGSLKLRIKDNSGRETLTLSDGNYPSNRTFDAIMDDILDMFVRKLPVNQVNDDSEVNWEPLPNLHRIPSFEEFLNF